MVTISFRQNFVCRAAVVLRWHFILRAKITQSNARRYRHDIWRAMHYLGLHSERDNCGELSSSCICSQRSPESSPSSCLFRFKRRAPRCSLGEFQIAESVGRLVSSFLSRGVHCSERFRLIPIEHRIRLGMTDCPPHCKAVRVSVGRSQYT